MGITGQNETGRTTRPRRPALLPSRRGRAPHRRRDEGEDDARLGADGHLRRPRRHDDEGQPRPRRGGEGRAQGLTRNTRRRTDPEPQDLGSRAGLLDPFACDRSADNLETGPAFVPSERGSDPWQWADADEQTCSWPPSSCWRLLRRRWQSRRSSPETGPGSSEATRSSSSSRLGVGARCSRTWRPRTPSPFRADGWSTTRSWGSASGSGTGDGTPSVFRTPATLPSSRAG